MDKNIQLMIECINGNADYRVLRRFKSEDFYQELPGSDLKSLCLIDFETTGVDDHDKAIEIGIIRVQYDPVNGRIGKILDRYCGLEDPGIHLPENIVALTGLTDDMVAGQSFDDNAIKAIVQKSNLIIAHNAEFDRGFAERRFEFMRTTAWACSIVDVPWPTYGISSNKLEFIAFKLGFFFDAHRAVADAEVTGGMLGQVLTDGTTGLWHLLQNARQQQWRVWATGASYSSKGILKSRGYEWRDVPGTTEKAWRIATSHPRDEIDFLRQNVLKPGLSVLIEQVGFTNRFTNRSVTSELIQV